MPNRFHLTTLSVHHRAIRQLGLAVLIALLTALAGCASTALTPAQIAAANSSRAYAQKIEVSGRLSAQYESMSGPQSIHINFTWSQTPEQTLISLGSPTGQTVATILINDQGALLTQTDKPPRSANDPNQLFLEMLGWPLPIAGLRDWLQGFIKPDHQLAATPSDTNRSFNAEGWDLRYPTWEIDQHSARPKRIDLSRQTEQAGLVSLRVVIDEWSTQP